MQVKLYNGLVRKLVEGPPPAVETVLFDVDLRRFALRLKPARTPGAPGAALYFIRYTVAGREKRMKVGDPRTMSLEEARKSARARLAVVDSGGDPAGDATAQRHAWTVRQLGEAYLASVDFRQRAERGQDTIRRAIANHLQPHLGVVKLADLDVPAVRRFIGAIEADTRTNSRKRRLGGRGAARKAVRVLSALLTWAVAEGHMKTNPLIGNIRLTGDGQRTTVMVEPEHYLAFLRAMEELVAEGVLRPVVRAFFIVKALTAMRRGELQALTWRQVDLDRRRIVLRESKGLALADGVGADSETVSLPDLAVAALAEIRPQVAKPGDLVFPPKQGRRLSVHRDWHLIRDRGQLPEGLVAHGLRHSAGTVAVLAGLSLPEVQKMLRHRNINTTQRYIHLAHAASTRLQDRAMAHVVPAAPAPRRT
jgi:integrase